MYIVLIIRVSELSDSTDAKKNEYIARLSLAYGIYFNLIALTVRTCIAVIILQEYSLRD